jgi:hypothetical protein
MGRGLKRSLRRTVHRASHPQERYGFTLRPAPTVISIVQPGRFSGFENHPNLIFFGVLKIAVNKVVTPALRRIQNGRAPFLASILDPVLELLSNVTQKISSNPLAFTIGIKKANYSLGLLKRPESIRSKESDQNNGRQI